MEDCERKSRILLLCLGSENSLEGEITIHVNELVDVFKCFEGLEKIMIFSKGKVVKAFIEYEKVEVAEVAKDVLNNTDFNTFGRMRIHFSFRNRISCENKLMDFWERADQSTTSPNSSARAEAQDSFKKTFINFSSMKSHSMAVNKNSSACNDYVEDSPFLPPTPYYKNTLSSAVTQPSYQDYLNSKCSTPGIIRKQALSITSDIVSPLRSVQLPSLVVLASNTEDCFHSAREVFNFFCIFGTIAKVVLMKNLHKALIEFTSLEGSRCCVDSLNRRFSEVSSLRVNYSKNFQTVDVSKGKVSDNSQKFNDNLVVTAELNTLTPAFPTPVLFHKCLLVSIVGEESSEKLDFYQRLREKVQEFDLAPQDIIKLGNSDALIIYNTIQEAFITLTRIQGLRVGNRLLKARFHAQD